MLTEKDIDEIEARLSKVFATKKDFQDHKSELMDKLDKILGEILASRDEQILISHKVSDHEDRLSNLEVAKTN